MEQQNAHTCYLQQLRYHAGGCRRKSQQKQPAIVYKGDYIHEEYNPEPYFQAFWHSGTPPAISPRK